MRGTVVLLTGIALVVALLSVLDPNRSWPSFALPALLFLAATAVHVVVHEAAHAGMAVAMGMGVPQVRIGEGPLLLRLRVRGTTIELRGFHSGATFVEPDSVEWLRTRLALMTAAGPTSNLCLAALAFWVVGPLGGPVEIFRVDMSIAGVFLGVLNLAPFRLRSARGIAQSDGWALLALLRARRTSSDQIVAASKLQAAARRHLEGAQVTVAGDGAVPLTSDDPLTLGLQGTRRIFTRELEEAITLFRRASDLPQDEGQLALTLNNLAWALVLAQPPNWLGEADHASARAFATHPWQEAMMNTRGCVLVHLGELGEARDLLKRAIDAEASASDRVVQHRHLLEAERGVGNLFGARASLFGLIDNGADEATVGWGRALLRSAEVDNALANLFDGHEQVRWPHPRDMGTEARHLREIRRALVDFVAHGEADDPRQEAVRRALGTTDDGQRPNPPQGTDRIRVTKTDPSTDSTKASP